MMAAPKPLEACPTCGTLVQGGVLMHLTKLQRATLFWIAEYMEANDEAPSYEEIQVAAGMASKSNVFRIIGCLVQRGWLLKKPHLRRAINLTPGAWEYVRTRRRENLPRAALTNPVVT